MWYAMSQIRNLASLVAVYVVTQEVMHFMLMMAGLAAVRRDGKREAGDHDEYHQLGAARRRADVVC